MDIHIVEQILMRDLPDLKISHIQILPNGWRNYVFLVNNQFIVRFPKSRSHNLQQQQQVLQKLSTKITYKLPQILYINQVECYAIYPAILACSYNKNDFEKFTKTERKHITFDLAKFLTQLHFSYSIKELEQMHTPVFDYKKENMDIQLESQKFSQLNVPVALKNLVIKQSNIAIFHLQQHYRQVLLHNDLHAGNIIIDCDSKKLNGIIDFDDIKIGHFHLDFANFFISLPIKFVQEIAKNYEELVGQQVYLDYAKAMAVNYLSSNLVKYPQNSILCAETIEQLTYLEANDC